MKSVFAAAGRISIAAAFIILAAAASLNGQPPAKPAEVKASPEVRGSAAYAEILLRRTEVQAELEALSAEYTDDYPKVEEARYLVELLEKERAKLTAVKPSEAGKLTLSLGKLIVAKADIDLELWKLRKTLQDGHPDVKRVKRKAEIYDAAIREILG